MTLSSPGQAEAVSLQFLSYLTQYIPAAALASLYLFFFTSVYLVLIILHGRPALVLGEYSSSF